MKLFGLGEGFFGGLFNRGGGSQSEEETSEHSERLKRISQRGRQDNARSMTPAYLPADPPADALDAFASVPAPGGYAASEPEIEQDPYAATAADAFEAPAAFDAPAQEPDTLELSSPYAEEADEAPEASHFAPGGAMDGPGDDFMVEDVEDRFGGSSHTEAEQQASEQPHPSHDEPEAPVADDFSMPFEPRAPEMDGQTPDFMADDGADGPPIEYLSARSSLSQAEEAPEAAPTTDFMAMPAATGDFALPGLAVKRKGSLGLTPMGGGEDEADEIEDEEEEEEPVYGEREEDMVFADEEEEPEEEGEDEAYDEEAADADSFDAAPSYEEEQVPAAEFTAPAEAGAETAVVFRQLFPPPHDDSLSFFGGLPIASAEFEWPRDANGLPYSFIMQVDCGEIPAHALKGMPARGLLYFFMHPAWGDMNSFRVVHEDAEAVGEVTPPEDLPPVYGDQARYAWKWPRGDAEFPRQLPKWPFKPVAVTLPETLWSDAGDEGEGARLWPEGAGVGDLLLQAQAEEIGSASFSIRDFNGEDGTLIRPWAQFPHDARAIQITTSLLIERLGKTHLLGKAAELEGLSDEDKAALLGRIQEEAQAWYDDASFEAPFIEVPQEVADQYWEWLTGVSWLARSVLSEALTLSVEASLSASAEAAARIPADTAAKVRSRHALALRTENGLHCNIPDRMLAPPVDVQGNQYERAQSHVLLFEYSSDEGLGHYLGEGVYQFWITPEDLAAGRFDKVVLTADAY